MKRLHTSDAKKEIGKVRIAGWVREIRKLGKLNFLILADREGSIQLTFKKGKNDELMNKLKDLTRESVVEAEGEVKKNKQAPGGVEIFPKKFEILNKAESPVPLEVREKPASLDTRLKHRFLDLRRPGIYSIFRIRSEVSRAAREFLDKNKFVEIHTPKITVSGTESGAEVFPIIYYGSEAFLVQSAQIYKQILQTAGLERTYEITPQWRAEKMRTRRHLTESWSVDVEFSFIESEEDVMKFLEDMTVHIMDRLKKNCKNEFEKLGKEIKVPKKPFKRITYDECLKILEEKNRKIKWGKDLDIQSTRLIAKKMKKQGHDFYFITKWPTEERPFYSMPDKNNPKLSRTFDLNLGEWEITSGAQRIHDPEILKKNIKEKGLNTESLKFYIDAFRYGMPPHGGFGLGLERFMAGLLGVENIREVVLFPRTPNRIIP